VTSLRRTSVAVLGPAAFLGLAFVMLGAALALAFTLLTAFLVSPLAEAASLPRSATVAIALLIGAILVLAVGVLPAVRRIEGVATESMLSVSFDGGPPQTATHWHDRWRSLGWLWAHGLAGAVLVLCTAAVPVLAFGPRPWLAVPAVIAVPVLVALLVAGLRRLAPLMLGPSLRERVDRLEQEATDLGERHRIAREIHDSVGHALSLVTVQAAAAARVQHSDPDFVTEALASIEDAARRAAGELDQVLGLLRVEPTARRPGPDLADLPDLVDAVRRAGLDVTLEDRPDEVGGVVPPVVSRELYRVAQEALSNVLRHGSGPCHVRLARAAAGVTLEVTNAAAALPQGRRPARSRSARHPRAGDGDRRQRERRPGRRRLATAGGPARRARPMKRVLLVDDEAMVRRGISVTLSTEEDIEVVGEAEDGAEAISQARRLRPDVVLMDIRMPRIDGISATRTITAGDSPPAVIVLTTFESDDHVYDALLAGARGYLLKRAPADEVVTAVRLAVQPDTLLFPAKLRELVRQRSRRPGARAPDVARLSTREGDVLRAMARGMSNPEIAATLYVGLETVKTHVAAVLAKLGVRDRTQAVIRAYESGFVVPDDWG
jgi:DNA-binding NarL/FixJ family response regulator/signal transduction histidine kinase